MKSRILLLLFCGSCLLAGAQVWSTRVERISGKPKILTLSLKPGYSMTLGTLDVKNDSVTKGRYYDGSFLYGRKDSLALKVKTVRMIEFHQYRSGAHITKNIPAALYPSFSGQDPAVLILPVNQLDFLSYQKKARKFRLSVPLLISSLAVMVVSPLICYNFNDHWINTGQYKYWALGSTAGAVCGFGMIFTGSSTFRTFQFHDKWPNKFAKTWKISE